MILNTPLKSLAAMVALALAGTTVMAGETSRADVVAQTLAARQAGTLIPAGEGLPLAAREHTSTLTRASVAADVRAARSSGDLLVAGEAAEFSRPEGRPSYAVTRAQVKADVITARASGLLIPAGEGPDAEGPMVSAHTARALASAH